MTVKNDLKRLQDSLINDLISIIEDGTATPGDRAVAAKILKDNNIIEQDEKPQDLLGDTDIPNLPPVKVTPLLTHGKTQKA